MVTSEELSEFMMKDKLFLAFLFIAMFLLWTNSRWQLSGVLLAPAFIMAVAYTVAKFTHPQRRQQLLESVIAGTVGGVVLLVYQALQENRFLIIASYVSFLGVLIAVYFGLVVKEWATKEEGTKMKLQLMNNKQFFITLPNTIIRAKEWQKGDEIVAKIDEKGNIVLKKA